MQLENLWEVEKWRDSCLCYYEQVPCTLWNRIKRTPWKILSWSRSKEWKVVPIVYLSKLILHTWQFWYQWQQQLSLNKSQVLLSKCCVHIGGARGRAHHQSCWETTFNESDATQTSSRSPLGFFFCFYDFFSVKYLCFFFKVFKTF